MVCEIDTLACANEEDRRQRETEALEREVNRLTAVTLAMAYAGDYDRLRDVLDYGDLDRRVFGALVSCARAGHTEAQDAVHALARKYGEKFAEIDE